LQQNLNAKKGIAVNQQQSRRANRVSGVVAVLLGVCAFVVPFDTFYAADPSKIVLQEAPLGCFKDQGDPQSVAGRDLNGSMSNSGAMTNAMCRTQCGAQGFRFAGTQYSSFCFCGNDYGKSGPSNACNARCTGNFNEICGGPWANTVYPAFQAVRTLDKSQFGDRGSARFAGAVPPPGGGSTQPPQPPANGGQCVISISGTNYSHQEVQRWEVTGPPATRPGVAGSVIPLRWTATGTTGGVAIAASADNALWVRTRNSDMRLLVSRLSAQVCAAGALKTSPTAGNWCEFGGLYPAPDLPAGSVRYDGVQQFVISTPVPGGSNALYVATWGYQKPASATGTATCEWHVVF
jgi:hypothetical protein